MADEEITTRIYEAEEAFNNAVEDARKAGLRVDAKVKNYGHVLMGLKRLESRVFRPIRPREEDDG